MMICPSGFCAATAATRFWRAINLVIAKGAYSAAAQMYPDDKIELRHGARVVEKSKP